METLSAEPVELDILFYVFFPSNLFLKSHLPASDMGWRQNERAEINVIARDFKANYVRPCSECRAELINPDSCPVLPRYFPVSHLVPMTPYKMSREMLLYIFNRLRIWDDRDAIISAVTIESKWQIQNPESGSRVASWLRAQILDS